MKRKITTETEIFDNDGKLVARTTETVEENDGGYIHPQRQNYINFSTASISGETIEELQAKQNAFIDRLKADLDKRKAL